MPGSTCIRWLHWSSALLIASATALSQTPTMAADERPDLQVKVTGLTGDSKRNVKVNVDNLSDWWSDRTTLTIQAVSPNQQDPLVLQVPDIGEKGSKETPSHYEFIYPLSADCDGHKVQASLTAGANYEGVKESSSAMANNVHELLVCNPKTAAAPAAKPQPEPEEDCDRKAMLTLFGCPMDTIGLVNEPDPYFEAIGRRNQWASAGPHSRTLTEPSVFRTHSAASVDEAPFFDCDTYLKDAIEPLSIGFSHYDGSGCNVNRFNQVLVNFDLGWLSQIANKEITGAHLLVTEVKPQAVAAATCMGALSVLPAGWESLPEGTRIFGGPATGVRLGDGPDGIRTWNVLNDVKNGAAPGKNLAGFVFRAIDENLEVEETNSCMSKLSSPQLRLEYTVGP